MMLFIFLRRLAEGIYLRTSAPVEALPGRMAHASQLRPHSPFSPIVYGNGTVTASPQPQPGLAPPPESAKVVHVKAAEFFQLPTSLQSFAPFFSPEVAPWEWLKAIGTALKAQDFSGGQALPSGVHVEGSVYVHPSAHVPHNATLIGPVWIGPGTKLLPGCYLRGNVIVGANCTVGHNAEIKNSLLMDNVQVPHRPYIGDSILGNGAHLGAGVVLSNLRLDQKSICVRLPEGEVVDTGLRKFGAILGDKAEVGCNAVLNPGVVLGKRALVTPTIVVSGYVPPATIAHVRSTVHLVPRRD